MRPTIFFNNPDKIQGLILFASYPANNNNLSSIDITGLPIYGTEDSSFDKLIASSILLPVDSKFVVLEDGNHAQFGDYGIQHVDSTALISREKQQSQIVNSTFE